MISSADWLKFDSWQATGSCGRHPQFRKTCAAFPYAPTASVLQEQEACLLRLSISCCEFLNFSITVSEVLLHAIYQFHTICHHGPHSWLMIWFIHNRKICGRLYDWLRLTKESSQVLPSKPRVWGGGGGVLPYMGYLGMCTIGYGFWGSWSLNKVLVFDPFVAVFLVWSLDRVAKLYYLKMPA